MNKIFLNNEFVESQSQELIDVRNPATGEVIGTIAAGNEADVLQAVASAKVAQKKWARVNRVKRAEIVKQLAPLITKHQEEIARLYQQEQGKVWQDALGEVEKAVQYIDYMTGLAQSNRGQVLQSQEDGEQIILVKKPVGVTAGIIPWNAPIFILMRKMIPALVTGCSIVVKPSEETPFATLRIAELIQETDIPAGLVQFVTGTGKVVGNLLAEHEDIALVSITGSTGAGKAVMQAAAKNVKKVNLELGGKAPAIVTAAADLTKAVDYLVAARIANSGQVCTCPERVYVQEGVATEFVAKLTQKMAALKVGDPSKEAVDLGPLINASQLKAVDEMVQAAVKQGAKVETGGQKIDRAGYYYQPTVLSKVEDDWPIMTDEIFGPVLPIVSYQTLEEVIDRANQSTMGLSSYIFTENLSEAMQASEQLEFGEVYVNCDAEEAITGYHAGWRQSGLGGADGINGFEEYLNTTVTYFRYR